jgi:triosephosphate isomerase
MNHTRALARAWCAALLEARAASPWPDEIEAGVAPAFTSLDAVREGLRGTGLLLGAQNAHWEQQGAFTGEIAPGMVVEAGCSFVIVGHSERRQHFGETDERVARKVHAIVDARLTPLLCVGETESEREAGATENVIERQLRRGLERLPSPDSRLLLAYEPIWAIGTGRVAEPQQAQEAQRFLRDALGALCGAEQARRTRLLYGGSVTPANALSLALQPDVDGFLVGGASLDALGFHRIVLACAEGRL